jgi:hypothetical protein
MRMKILFEESTLQRCRRRLLDNFKIVYIIMVYSYIHTYLWSRALLEELQIVQLLKNFPAFYGT